MLPRMLWDIAIAVSYHAIHRSRGAENDGCSFAVTFNSFWKGCFL